LRSIIKRSGRDRGTRSLIREGARNPTRLRSDLTPVLEEMQQSLSEIKQNNLYRCSWIRCARPTYWGRAEDVAPTKM
jgi:hypothetical protein